MPNDEFRRRNLAALRAFQPAVADAVEAAVIPQGIVEACGRDGSRTFRIPDAEGEMRWFGGSSMPGVSGAELLREFSSNGENVALPGVLTGFEPRFIVSRLPPHCALFVLEPEAAAIQLALRLYDYAEAIAGGRLVFVTGGELHENLVAFFAAHPGYRMPTLLLTSPQRTPLQITTLQRALESAAAAIAALQDHAVQSVRARMVEQGAVRLPDRPRLAVVSTDAGPMTRAQAERLEQLKAWGRPHEICIPDHPEKCHLVARIEAVHLAGADWVLALNSPAGSIAPWLPPDVPVAAWALPGTSAFVSGTTVTTEYAFACRRTDQRQWVASGLPSQRVHLCPVAAGTPPPELRRERSGAIRAAVFLDLAEVRAEALQLTLPSHVALWHALLEMAAADSGLIDEKTPAKWFEGAQRASGTVLRDAQICENFLTLIRGCVVPYANGLGTVKALVQAGCVVSSWGMNWPAIRNAESRGPIPTGRALREALSASEAVIFPDPSPFFVQTALDALSIGTEVFLGCTSDWFREEYAGLEDVAEFLRFHTSFGELLEGARRLRYDDDGAGAKRRQAAANLVRGRHTVMNRLQMIEKTLRSGTVTCGPF